MSLSTPAPSMTEFVRISGILERSPELRKQNIKHKMQAATIARGALS